MTTSRIAIAVLVAAALVGLTGCFPGVRAVPADQAPATSTPVTPLPDTTATSDAEGTLDCGGQPAQIGGSAKEIELIGTCPTVSVSGTDLEIDMDRATVGSVDLHGDRIEVDGADLQTLTIEGQDNDIDATTIGLLTIRGDRNEVDTDQTIGSIAVNGNDNEVTGGVLGDVADNGDRNAIRTR